MVAAMATFDDLAAVQANVARLVHEREWLREALAAIPWLEPLPSDANFLLCRISQRDAKSVADALFRRGILVRHVSIGQVLTESTGGYIRISVGRRQDNLALVEALRIV